MSEKKLAKVFYADLWGLREEKYEYLFKKDVQTTKWQELEPVGPYYFFVPKDYALQSEYGNFWKVTEIFGEWSEAVKTHRDHSKRIPNFTPEFLQAVKESLGSEPTPEEIFYYIYAILYFSTYRKRYEEFLKIDFPRVPLPSNYETFKELSSLGKELVALHLLKASALNETEIGFPKEGSRKVEKVSYDEKNQRTFINKEQYFEGISKEVWEYRIGAYQTMGGQFYFTIYKARGGIL